MISETQTIVHQFRDQHEDVWPTPHPRDTLHFLLSEVMEVADWMMRNGHALKDGYVRAHDGGDDSVATEIAQVQIMLCTLATQLDVDLLSATQTALYKIGKMATMRHRSDRARES